MNGARATALSARQQPVPRRAARGLMGKLGMAMAMAMATATALAALALSLPPLRSLIEQSMVWHMLVQMPLLVLSGACAGAAWTLGRGQRWNRFGLTGFMLAQCILAYWMIPAMVDRAVVLPTADAVKLLTLWLAGLALHQGLRAAPLAVQLFFIGYGLPMMAWLGLYLATTDLRLCNAYSLQSQLRAGWGLLALALLLGVAWGSSVAATRHLTRVSSPPRRRSFNRCAAAATRAQSRGRCASVRGFRAGGR